MKMQTGNNLETIRKLLDETPIITIIADDLPPYYKHIIISKIKDLHNYLEQIHEIEINLQEHRENQEPHKKPLTL